MSENKKSNMSVVSSLANQLHGNKRKEFWRIYHNSGEVVAKEYFDDVIQDQLQDQLRDEMVENRIFGTGIEDGALAQYNNASRLYPAIKSALMPDAHQGYGLPIGGVLALDNAISPYAVGVDIGCRMKISIFRIANGPQEWHPDFKLKLIEQTRFGMGAAFKPSDIGGMSEHVVLGDPDWAIVNKLVPVKGSKTLYDIAVEQLGSSGGGNHFVEWGVVTIKNPALHEDFNYEDQYLALLSHSGSRGVGAKIADHFSKLAMNMRPNLPQSVKHLAWFDMDTQEGQEYWMAMNLAGKFAKANHDVIHKRIADSMGLGEPMLSIDNHHNFAWIEDVVMANGETREAYVHRKGATPAGKGVLGIIPGSMATKGYVVKGKGNHSSINSASHGAGRAMSRRAAHDNLSKQEWLDQLKAANVDLIGGSLDEATNAYKDIEKVMASQTELVEVQAEFEPRLVRMADDGFAED
jgi:tRNA-splicing ligase RtcB